MFIWWSEKSYNAKPFSLFVIGFFTVLFFHNVLLALICGIVLMIISIVIMRMRFSSRIHDKRFNKTR